MTRMFHDTVLPILKARQQPGQTIRTKLFTLFGMACSAGSLALVALLALRRIFLGPEENGVFTLFAILFQDVGI
jgi:hypothetical protein